jgi:hypothetical protein
MNTTESTTLLLGKSNNVDSPTHAITTEQKQQLEDWKSTAVGRFLEHERRYGLGKDLNLASQNGDTKSVVGHVIRSS